MKCNMNAWKDDLLCKKREGSLPILSYPAVQLLGIPMRELVRSGALQADCMGAIAERYPMLASVSNMDLSVEAEAFGAHVNFADDEIPSIVGHIVDTEDDATALRIPRVGTQRTQQSLLALTIAEQRIDDRPILAGVIGPFSLAGRLIGMTEIMIDCMVEPDLVHIVLKKVTSFLIDYVEEMKKVGANGIILAEPAAGLLSPQLCLDFSSNYVKQIIDAVQDSSFIVIYHNCGNTVQLVEPIKATGAALIHLGNAVKLQDVIQKYPPSTIVMGNLDPVQFRYGSPESIAATTKELLSTLSKYPNWVLSSGCDIPASAPIENIDTFFNTVQSFYEI